MTWLNNIIVIILHMKMHDAALDTLKRGPLVEDASDVIISEQFISIHNSPSDSDGGRERWREEDPNKDRWDRGRDTEGEMGGQE